MDMLKVQVNKEFYAAYLYLDMANFYADKNLDGFANWFYVQAQEVLDHAMLISKYLLNNGIRPELEAIAKPDKEFKELIDPLEAALEHEKYVTKCIHEIYDAAMAEKDYRSKQLLDWFVLEQNEEEANADSLLQKMKMIGSGGQVFMLDAQLAQRKHEPLHSTLIN